MANITVPSMPTTTASADDDQLHIIQSGIDKNITVLNKIKSEIDSVTAVNGDTVTPSKRETILSVDTTSADATITIASGSYAGQKLHIINTGTNILTINGGNGIYTNGVFITSNTGGWHGEWSGSEWTAINEITADYTSNSQRILKSSNGDLEILYSLLVTTSNSAGNVFTSAAVSLTLEIPFLTSGYRGDASAASSAGQLFGGFFESKTASSINIKGVGPSSTSTGTIDVHLSGGKY